MRIVEPVGLTLRGLQPVEIKLFVREGCPMCPVAISACEVAGNLSVYDLDNPDGRAEAFVWRVTSAPSVVVVDSSGREHAAWHGAMPEMGDLTSLVAN